MTSNSSASASSSLQLKTSLGDDDVRSGDEEGGRGEHREPGEGDQAEPVEHHGRKLPVVLDRIVVLVRLQLVRQHPQLLQDHGELPHRARRQWRHLLRLKEGKFVGRSELENCQKSKIDILL